MEYAVGDRIKIIAMQDEPEYDGATGIVTKIDDLGQLHGTWGGLAVDPLIDDVRLVSRND